jgi:hypothetical protein
MRFSLSSTRISSSLAIAATVAVLGLSPAMTFAAPPAFSNQTVAAGVNVSHFTTGGFSNANYTGGGAVGDFNNDGWQDLFVISGGGNSQPDFLFINNGNGTFTNQAAAWGLTSIHRGKGATVGDYNNDGWLDLYVTSAGPIPGAVGPGHHKLYRNNGDNTFTNVAAAAGVATTNPSAQDGWGGCFGDYDLDGDLDLIVGGSTANNAGSRLFRNNGDATFTNVTAAIGLFTGIPGIFGFTPALVDMDDDLYPDLLFVGDFGTSRYFKNDTDGTFTEWTDESNAAQEENGMGQTRGDFNNDAVLDWYVTSIYSPSIGWTGNKLYRNNGGHDFSEYSNFAGTYDGGYGWGTIAVDFDHDGRQDIAETNGDGGTGGMFANEQSYLWMNQGNNTFTEQALSAGLVQLGRGRAMMHFDYDNDGDQDVVITSFNEPLFLFRNDLNLQAGDTRWLRVFLSNDGRTDIAPGGYGARVFATVGPTTSVRAIDGGESFLCMNELSAHFGFGSATSVAILRVRWSNGEETVLHDVPTNQTITVTPAPLCPSDLTDDQVVDGADLGALLVLWGSSDPQADMNDDTVVDGADLGQLLKDWGACG